MADIYTPGIAAHRLSADQIAENFSDLHKPLDRHEAAVAADRCYFCYDAPCVTACPTGIDIPLFIRQIAADQPESAGRTILDQNILGGMCARVCPTEDLCEGACVRELAEGEPVQIGRLQRHATDAVMARQSHPYARAASTGKRIAVVGAGPAGLSCAHRLAMRGHDVVLYDAKEKPGGLNEFGIAAYKSEGDFAQSEVAWLMQIGGIDLQGGKALGVDLSLEALTSEFDAVFLGVGLAGVNALRAEGETRDGVQDAVGFIAALRQAEDKRTLPVGRNVVVIGGGMTAIDAAVQSKLLGAETVTLAYRRGQDRMGASRYEQDLATSKGVRIICNAMPLAVHGNGAAQEVELEYTADDGTGLKGTGERMRLPADQVLKAIGQTFTLDAGLALENGKIAVNANGRTSVDGVWAGGDCVATGDDLTVWGVAQGRDAAEDIHAQLMGQIPADTGAVIGEAARG
ncbi:NAD-dependent dihydropyrimidine dehydrogenase subunit PreT [Rhodobacteraceae bacterium THAF1]|uniref:NAD(P)-dependent oxidoreductase n=1 Tax=Palleronia sp. THAF1 TaxID=2587842 RepID=UPI000F4063E1|nr:NAD(P)-dependent oxidoreductase [Palleronia sp. THAF1]QFU08508.1 NAD-dependent dihydropyrimidine dehydrogenase subunit PreT [Palleronia sp. THAF1]VDC28591.1 NAD-dependent dihydropyrimidine dehydrogenase subunit PreT [Rhodobacteraceae bacterium THAF1]